MTALILGANGSGKSACAEGLAARLRDGRVSRPQSGGAVCRHDGHAVHQRDGRACPMYYFATMIPYGEEGRARVEKHRQQRASAGFITVERQRDVAGVPLPPGATVLLEDVSNLLGNALFGATAPIDTDATSVAADGTSAIDDGMRGAAAATAEDSVFGDIAALCGKCSDAVLVSIDGLDASGPDYDDETRGYIGALNRLNARLVEFADAVITMCAGEPEYIKCSDQWTV